MVSVSEAASAFMMERLTSIPIPPDTGYRLDASKGGYKLHLDRPADKDRVVRCEGQVVLMVAPDVDARLDGTILAVKAGDDEGLVLEPAGQPDEGAAE